MLSSWRCAGCQNQRSRRTSRPPPHRPHRAATCLTRARAVRVCQVFRPHLPRPLQKPEWDSVDAERVRTACDPAASADLAVVLITVGGWAGVAGEAVLRRWWRNGAAATGAAPAPLLQEGLAHLCLVGSTCTLTRAKIESSIPRKRGAAAAG